MYKLGDHLTDDIGTGPSRRSVVMLIGADGMPVVVEGRVHTLEHAAVVMRLGAHAVCVGTAITHPSTITGWFAEAVTPA